MTLLGPSTQQEISRRANGRYQSSPLWGWDGHRPLALGQAVPTGYFLTSTSVKTGSPKESNFTFWTLFEKPELVL